MFRSDPGQQLTMPAFLPLRKHNPMKYVIIGAVAGGASTAARLRRLDEKAQIVIFEKTGYISYANCGLPYYIGNVIKERDKLFVQTAAGFHSRFNVDVRVNTEVVSIDPHAKTVTSLDHLTGKYLTEQYDKLVLSPGATPVRPGLPGIDLEGIFTLRNVRDTDHIKAYVQKRAAGRAIIIGGGFIGLEMAENLKHAGMQVTLIEKDEQVMAPLDFPMAALVQQYLRAQEIDLRLSTSVTGFSKMGSKICVLTEDGNFEADVVILSIGVQPDLGLAKMAGLQTGKGIRVNEYLQTSDPDIYAIGDAIEFTNPITGQTWNTYLAGPANKQGRICANNIIMGNSQPWKGSVHTAIAKIFELTAGCTGMSSKELKRAGIDHLLSTTHSFSHANYYPGAEQMTIQLAFAPGTGKLYGAQVVGMKGVDKRLDVLSNVLGKGGNIDDLCEFEQAYAPPFSSARDAVNIAGMAAENILQGRMEVYYCDSSEISDAENLLVDVRTEKEFSEGHIAGAINIPLDVLRMRLHELPKDREILIYCQIGLRGYLACRILEQEGFCVKNLSGGYRTWIACAREREMKLASSC